MTTIVKTELELPEPARSKGKLAFFLDNVLSPKECQEFIDEMESGEDFKDALVNVGAGQQKMMTDVRKSKRKLVFDKTKAEMIFERIKEFLPQEWEGHPIVSLNERLSVLKYLPGDYFKPHFDGAYVRDDMSEGSFITIQLYLNEGFKGGNTTFLDGKIEKGWTGKDVGVVPKTGRVLVFQHQILHEGSLLESGIKYSVRTDVMYKL